MSTGKLKNHKASRTTETHSRNSLINALIKNKLQQQMPAIKNNLIKILKKDSSPHDTPTHILAQKHKSYTITPKKIEDSLSYNPAGRAVEQFITSRQIDSYLLSRQQLMDVHKARKEPVDFATKFSNSNRISYSVPDDLVGFSREVEEASVKEFAHETWLTGQSEIANLIDNKRELLEDQYAGSGQRSQSRQQLQKWVKQIIPSHHQNRDSIQNFFNPPIQSITSHYRSKSTTNLQPKPPQINTTYSFKKYHKDDYKSLQLWLDEAITAAVQTLQQQPIQTTLNTVYSIYMSTWKQLIRFTYIQSYQKALLLQKILYSTLRLFSNLISQQHICSRNLHKVEQQSLKSLCNMCELRSQKLGEEYERLMQSLEEIRNSNHRLCVTFRVYEKVNKQLVEELQRVSQSDEMHERELNTVSKVYLKTLDMLHGKGLIELQYDEMAVNDTKPSYKNYYMIDKENKPVTLGRFKSQTSSSAAHFITESQTSPFSHTKTIKQLDNQINRFWHKKHNDLDIQNTMNSLLSDVEIRDSGTCTAQYLNVDIGCQFPEEPHQQFIQRLLDQLREELQAKFNRERQLLEQKLARQTHLLSKWQISYEQMQERYKNSSQANKRLEERIKKMQESLTDIKQEILQLTSQKQLLLSTVQHNQQQIETLKTSLHYSHKSEDTTKLALAKIQKLLSIEKQNNYSLVRSNLSMKEMVGKAEIKYEGLLGKVKGVSAWLEKFMTQVDNQKSGLGVDWGIMGTACEKIQQYLGEYVERDSALFMTKI